MKKPSNDRLRRLGILGLSVLGVPALCSVSNAQLAWTGDGAGSSGAPAPTLWLRADTVTPNSSVSAWTDARGGGAGIPNLTPSGTAPVQTSSDATLNNQASIAFNGSGLLMDSAVTGSSLFGSGSAQNTIFIVENYSSGNNSVSWVDNGTGSSQVAAFETLSGSTTYFSQDTSAVTDGISASSATPGGVHVLTFQRNGGTGSIRMDGTALALSDSTFNANLTSGTAGTLGVGGYVYQGAPNNAYSGNIAEVLIYNTALSSTDIGNVESYLGNRYGISAVPEPTQYAIVFSMLMVGVAGIRIARRPKHA